MNNKRFLSCLLAVLMLFSLVPIEQAQADSDWSSQFESFILNQEYLQSGLSFNSDAYSQPRFSLYDLDHNGEPELLAFNGGPSLAASTDYVFTHESWDVNYIGNVGYRGCELYYYEGAAYPGLFCSDGNNGVIRTTYYEMRDGSILSQDLGESAVNSGGTQRFLPFYTLDEIRSMGWNAFVRETVGAFEINTSDITTLKSNEPYTIPEADNSWNPIYESFVLKQEFLSAEYRFLKFSSNIEPRFSLYDLDSDSIPELLVEGGTTNQALQVHVFNFQNGVLHYSGNMPLKPYRYVDAPYRGLFCESEDQDGKRTHYYELSDGFLVSSSIEISTIEKDNTEHSHRYTYDRDLYAWLVNGQPSLIPFYSFSEIQVMGWQRFVLERLWKSSNITIGSLTTMNQEQQYAANIFLSNFSEQNRFQSRDFDVNDRNLDDIVYFAYLYCKINRRSALNSIQNDKGYFYTLSLVEANKVWERHFGFTVSETDAAAFPLVPGTDPHFQSYYDAGTFYFTAADGESYNRFTVVRQMENIGDGSYRLIFDIYKLDINEYWRANGVDSGFYAMSASAAREDPRLTLQDSGVAVVRPYTNNGIATYQLVKYGIDKPLKTSALQDGETTTIHFRQNGHLIYECAFNEHFFSEGASKRNNNLALFAGFLSWGVYHDSGLTTIGDIYSEMGIYEDDILNLTAEMESREESLRYAIAEKDLLIDGERTVLLMIALRGTLTHDEKAGDIFTKADSDIGFSEYKAYGLIYNFAKEVMDSVRTYARTHPELETEKIKVLITGHSLGGAGANLIGAMINDSIEKGGWYNVHDKEDVYVYTFGAIDSINSCGTVSKGFENIHNITNYYDSYGPKGWVFPTAAGNSRYGKFGHIDLFFYDRDNNTPYSYENHSIQTYLSAIDHSSVFYEIPRYQKYARFHCPVDISVYKKETLVAQVKDEVITYDNMEIPVIVMNGEKHFFLTDTENYRFEITATDTGTMSCEFGDLSTWSDEKTFTDIKLEPGKTMCMELGYNGSAFETRMFVLNEKQQAALEILEDGSETSLDDSKGSNYSTIVTENHLDGTQAGSTEIGASPLPEATKHWLIVAVSALAVGIICFVILLTIRRKKPTKNRTTKAAFNHTQEKATLPAFSETCCCICGHRLDEKYGIFFRTKDGQEARIDADCYRQLYILRKSEDEKEIREARRYICSRYDVVDSRVASQLRKYVKLADDYLSES